MSWHGALLASLLLLTCCHAAQLRLAVLPQQETSGQAAHKSGMHDLVAFARGLEKLGHAVTVITKLPEKGVLELMATGPGPDDALFDAILSQGAPPNMCSTKWSMQQQNKYNGSLYQMTCVSENCAA